MFPNLQALKIEAALAGLARRENVQLLCELGQGRSIQLDVHPQLRFVIFGKGPEVISFASIAKSAGYNLELYSSDPETLKGFTGQETMILHGGVWPDGLKLDRHSAVTLFFHDHDLELNILAEALRSKASYIGAMGSQRAHRQRLDALSSLGVAPEQLARLSTPFGLIPSARNPQTLAISVLADVLNRMPFK